MSMGPEDVIRTLVEEGFNNGNLAVVDELVAATMVENEKHDPEHPDGPEGVKRVIAMVKDAFPDYRLTIDDCSVDGEKVWVRMTGTGTNAGAFFGYPATNKRATFMAIEEMRVVDGRIVEHWAVVDMFGAFVQLGLMPAPSPMPSAG